MGVLYPGQLLTSGRGIGRDEAAQRGLQVLIGSLTPSVALRVESRGQADGGAKLGEECLPELCCELWTSVGDYICRETMETKHMLDHELGCLLGSGQLG